MDRRFVLAIVLMMVVLVVPPLVLKKPARAPVKPPVIAVAPVPDSAGPVVTPSVAGRQIVPLTPADSTRLTEDTVLVRSALYQYRFSTRGGRMIGAELIGYRSMRRDEPGQRVEILSPKSEFLSLALLVGSDTVPLSNVAFRPSTTSLTVTDGAEPSQLTFTAAVDSKLTLDLTYSFVPKDYRVEVRGVVRGLGPTGGFLQPGLKPA